MRFRVPRLKAAAAAELTATVFELERCPGRRTTGGSRRLLGTLLALRRNVRERVLKLTGAEGYQWQTHL